MRRSRIGVCVIGVFLTASPGFAEWKSHEVRQLNGGAEQVKLPAQLQIVTEAWNRVVAVPYIVYMPEKDRVLMLVGCDYPHHAEVLWSDDHGKTWTAPRPIHLDEQGKPVGGLGTSLTYLGKGGVLCYTGDSRWFSKDYGETWGEPVPIAPTPEGKPWYIWDPALVERDPATGAVTRLAETGYTVFGEPGNGPGYSHGYIRFSADQGKTWGDCVKPPQWVGINEVALLRARNNDLVAACRTDIPASRKGETLDHYEGLGISISKDDGKTWSAVNRLYDWGRHHPSLVLMPNGDILMTYVVRKGYVDAKDGVPQFGIEAVISPDNGQTWDLDHRYILDAWIGNRTGPNGWWASCQATSTVLLPDGSLLTAFGTGYRSQPAPAGPGPRDAGLVQWRLNDKPGNADHTVADAPFDSDLRNVFDPKP